MTRDEELNLVKKTLSTVCTGDSLDLLTNAAMDMMIKDNDHIVDIEGLPYVVSLRTGTVIPFYVKNFVYSIYSKASDTLYTASRAMSITSKLVDNDGLIVSNVGKNLIFLTPTDVVSIIQECGALTGYMYEGVIGADTIAALELWCSMMGTSFAISPGYYESNTPHTIPTFVVNRRQLDGSYEPAMYYTKTFTQILGEMVNDVQSQFTINLMSPTADINIDKYRSSIGSIMALINCVIYVSSACKKDVNPIFRDAVHKVLREKNVGNA